MTLGIPNYQFLQEENLIGFHQPTNTIIETIAYTKDLNEKLVKQLENYSRYQSAIRNLIPK